MNKVIVGIIGLVIIIGLAFYFMQDNDTQPDDTENTDQQTPAETTPANAVVLSENTSGDTVTAERVVLAEPGYVVIYRVATEGDVNVIGVSALLTTGEHTDVEIVLEGEVAAEDTIVATLHTDDGDGEYSESDLPLTVANGFVTDVDVIDVAVNEEDDTLAANVTAYLEETSGVADEGDASPETDVVEFTISAENYRFSEESIRVQEGQTVRITLVNQGGLHDFVIDEFEGAQSERIQTGETETIEFVADEAGTYAFYCSIGQHRELGMEGTFIVE